MRRKIKDQRDLPKANRPPTPKSDRILYHWSPTRNRKSINKVGLVPGRLTLQGHWRPPFVCLADDPELGWRLSGLMYPGITEWDLWLCYLDHQSSFDHYEIILDTFVDTGRHYIKEYRVYTRIYKRDLRYIATRRQ